MVDSIKVEMRRVNLECLLEVLRDMVQYGSMQKGNKLAREREGNMGIAKWND